MANNTHLAGVSPGSIGKTLSDIPRASSVSVTVRGNDGTVLGELNVDIDKAPDWLEYLHLVSGIAPEELNEALHALCTYALHKSA